MLFDDLAAGKVALVMSAAEQPHVKLVDQKEDMEWGVVKGEVKQVFGSGPFWTTLNKPGEKEIVEYWAENGRWHVMRQILQRNPTQSEMDVATDVIQWLGTAIGNCFVLEARARFEKQSRLPLNLSQAQVDIGAYSNAQGAISEQVN